MRRIHFDGRGPVWWHYPFWQPWGCLGCLGRILLFALLFFIFLLLLSQFRSCNGGESNSPGLPRESSDTEEVVGENGGVPPINDEDVIDDGGRQIVSNRLNVLFQAEVGEQGMEDWKTRFKELYPGDEYIIIFSDVETKLIGLQVPVEKRSELLRALPDAISDIPFIVFEEEVMTMTYRPGDPALSDADATWHLAAVQAEKAWDRTKGNSNVIVAVVDSYFDLDNPELDSTEIVRPYSVANGDSNVGLPSSYNPGNPDPVLCHGTMVASLALGAMDNGHGSAGIAPECSFMPISLGSRFGCLALLQGLLYAVNHGARVVNISAGLSFTGEMASVPVERQIAMAQSELLAQEEVWKYVFDMCSKYYVTVVWAAGNENVFTALDASKRGSNTIKVSASDRNGRKADFSNFGNFAERNIYESTVSAPGVKVYGEVPSASHQLVDGTSFSAPIVAGATGLIKSLDPSLSTVEISEILRSTGVPVTGNTTIGPIIQIGAALDKVVDGFLPFDRLKTYCNGAAVDTVTVPTTFLVPFEYSSDRAVLPAVVKVAFQFCGNGKGRIVYTSNLWPEQWTADIECRYDSTSDKVVISQGADAECVDRAPFKKAEFTVVSQDGVSCIDRVESESIPGFNKSYLKKN